MTVRVLVGEPAPGHFIRWEFYPDREGGVRLIARCEKCRGVGRDVGWTWTPAHGGPSLGEVLNRVEKETLALHGEPCPADDTSTTGGRVAIATD